MTELQLYKFIQENNIEYHWYNRRVNRYDVIILIDIALLPEFVSLFDGNYLVDQNTECTLKKGYLAVWMQDIAEYYNIDLESVFGENTEIEVNNG